MVNRSEIRRLEKAAKNGDKKVLAQWAIDYETQIASELRILYNKRYMEEIEDSISNMMIAIAYTLYYSEEVQIEKEAIPDFIADLLATVDTYKTGESTPVEYKEELQKIGITFSDYDYNKLYREKIERLDVLLKEYTEKVQELDLKLDELEQK